ncbi:MAG: hypothetical protein ACU836_18530 [Gammaproteobacteria bacterium]
MQNTKSMFQKVLLMTAIGAMSAPGLTMVSIQVGTSGKTYASNAVSCAADPTSGAMSPVVEAGLYNPKKNARATVWLNGVNVATVIADAPGVDVSLEVGDNIVVVVLNNNSADSYAYNVPADSCALPDTTANTFSPDGSLEYGASGKSYATVVPGCAWNSLTGQAQPYVNLFDSGSYLLNVSVNDLPLTQLSASRPHTPVFLSAGINVISVAYGYISTDYYVRDGGDGSCALP